MKAEITTDGIKAKVLINGVEQTNVTEYEVSHSVGHIPLLKIHQIPMQFKMEFDDVKVEYCFDVEDYPRSAIEQLFEEIKAKLDGEQ